MAACEREIAPQAIARGRREAEALDRHVEIEIVQRALICDRIDDAEPGVDAERARFLMKGCVRLERRLEQELDGRGARPGASGACRPEP